MRFRKGLKPTAYNETSRKRAAFLPKQWRERDAMPLFADMIAAGQHSVDEEMARRADWMHAAYDRSTSQLLEAPA